jgi:site-specific DNA-methyltransferase (adenine-specific)
VNRSSTCERIGFRIVGHIVFGKTYASSVRLLRYQHELACLLARRSLKQPACPSPDVIEFRYTGNRPHPTEKPISALMPLIGAFSNEGDLVLDPLRESGSTLLAARKLCRRFLGVELERAGVTRFVKAA